MDLARWLTIAEAAQRAGCSCKTLRRAIQAGALRCGRTRVRGAFRLLAEDIDRYIVNQNVPRRRAPVRSAPTALRSSSDDRLEREWTVEWIAAPSAEHVVDFRAALEAAGAEAFRQVAFSRASEEAAP